jgi:hypothetical protein
MFQQGPTKVVLQMRRAVEAARPSKPRNGGGQVKAVEKAMNIHQNRLQQSRYRVD